MRQKSTLQRRTISTTRENLVFNPLTLIVNNVKAKRKDTNPAHCHYYPGACPLLQAAVDKREAASPHSPGQMISQGSEKVERYPTLITVLYYDLSPGGALRLRTAAARGADSGIEAKWPKSSS